MSSRTLEHYMSLPYKVEVIPEDDGSGFTAIVPELPGCMTCADTIEELWEMVTEAKQLWLEVALENGDHIPEPAPVEDEQYSGRFVVRLPRSLHRQLAQRAEWEDTSLNTLVVTLLSDGMGRWGARLVFEPKTAQVARLVPGLRSQPCPIAGMEESDLTAQVQWTNPPIQVRLITEAGITVFGTADESAGSHEEDPIPMKYWPGVERLLQVDDCSVGYKVEGLDS